ncbi:MAG TPA: DUF2933 domain-containing protein [Acidimicrobiales bacterium]
MVRNHLTHCLVGVVAAAALLVAFGVEAGALGYLAVVLACPLMMVLMMRGMMSGHGQGRAGRDHPDQSANGREATGPAERAR